MKRCPECGAKLKNYRASYCSQTCRDAHEHGRSRDEQFKTEIEGKRFASINVREELRQYRGTGKAGDDNRIYVSRRWQGLFV